MIAIIAAYDRNRVIGRDGHMPWHIPGEQRRFRELTTGAAVIMGRRTWADIGHPLPGRRSSRTAWRRRSSSPGSWTPTSPAARRSTRRRCRWRIAST